MKKKKRVLPKVTTLRRALKNSQSLADDWRARYYAEQDRANIYRKCMREVLVALGEHGPRLNTQWLGQKLGEMFK